MASPSDLGIDGIDDLASLGIDGSAIFRAREVRHHRRVAIKILDSRRDPLVPRRRLDPRNRALQTFAQTAGVVPVYRTGTTSYGDRYLIMPLYRAGSLADQLAYGSTPWHASAALIAQIGEVLANGHARGVVLTGITPSSILLSNATSPVLAVYGMAMSHADDGRPSYRAPEIDRGGAKTAAADVYSLGLNLAALIAGRPPTETRACRNLLNEVDAVAPARIVDVLARATQEEPEDRYRAAGEFAVALRAAIDGDRILDAPPPPGTDNSVDIDAILAPLTTPRSGPPLTNERGRVVHKSQPPLPTRTARTASTTTAKAVAVTGVTGLTDPGISLTEPDISLTEPDIDLTEPSAGSTVDVPAVEVSDVEVSVPPPPIVAAPFVPIIGLAGDDDVPFRTVEHPRVSTNPSRLVRFLDRVQIVWLSVRRSLGALLAVITLLVIAGIVAMVVLQQRQAPQSTGGGSFTTAQEVASPSTFRPTSVAPLFLEPPATHLRGSQPGAESTDARSSSVIARPPSTTPSARVAGTATIAATAVSARPPSTPRRSAALTSPAPTSSASTSANRVTTARPSTTLSVTSTAPATSADLAAADESLTVSLTASRLRLTSARIRLSSSSCVTASFTYAAVGSSAPGGAIAGETRCSTSHNLSLGLATPALAPGTTYTVNATATDQRGRSTSSVVSFTTLG
ncbi:MAG: protein kinase domain-containing protein [Acidimicrobiales bacterium]